MCPPVTVVSASTASPPVVAVWPVVSTTTVPTWTSTTPVTSVRSVCVTSTRLSRSSGSPPSTSTRYVQKERRKKPECQRAGPWGKSEQIEIRISMGDEDSRRTHQSGSLLETSRLAFSPWKRWEFIATERHKLENGLGEWTGIMDSKRHPVNSQADRDPLTYPTAVDSRPRREA